MRKRYLAALGAAVGLAVLPVAAPAGAGVGDAVLNPGNTTVTFQQTEINIAGQNLSLPRPSDPPQCSNGENDDIALDEPDNPASPPAQDTLIDFAGGDPECSGPDDNSEVEPGFQPKTDITIDGSIATDGTVALDSSAFPPLYVWVWQGSGFALRLDFSADVSAPSEGTLDPTTGALAVDLPLDLIVNVPDGGGGWLAACDTGSFAVGLNTDAGAPVNGGAVPVSPFAYNSADAWSGLTNNTLSIPAMTALIPDPGIEFFCDSLNTSFGLPSASGNAVQLQITSPNTDLAEPFFGGGSSSTLGDLVGTVTDGGVPVANMPVAVYSATSVGRKGLAYTDANGQYAITGINAGRYKTRILGSATYPTKWWQASLSYGAGDVVSVPQGSSATANYTVGEQSQIAGTVTDGASPVAGAVVRLYTPDGFYRLTTTDGSGAYDLSGLPARSDYAIRVVATGYPSEWYQDAATYSSPGRVDIDAPAGGAAIVHVDLGIGVL